VPTAQRDDHPEGYPLLRGRAGALAWDAATGGAVLTKLGQPEGLVLPNKNAAVCASNAAAALLQVEEDSGRDQLLQAERACLDEGLLSFSLHHSRLYGESP
jgi:hypothetical protein